MAPTRTLSVLGSTGSIGRQTLDVARCAGYNVAGLAFGHNVDQAEEQIRAFHPRYVATPDAAAAAELRTRIADLQPAVTVESGEDAVLTAAALPEADTVVLAVVGIAALKPTLAAVQAGKRIALANKEALVCAGELVMGLAREKRVPILPVDSEHSAIFQCLISRNPEEPTDAFSVSAYGRRDIERLILTASGGPFFGMDREALSRVTKADALRHPTWNMGAKITIDSASMMNKGLEVIEAMRLYDVPADRISVMVHRESIVHSLVEFRDGSILAQLGCPDMRVPIQYAITWPEHTPGPAKKLDLLHCKPITFQQPDLESFRCLALGFQCAKEGGTSTAILNGANEAAVALFLEDRISFLDIPKLIEEALNRVEVRQHPTLEEIFAADRSARAAVLDMTR